MGNFFRRMTAFILGIVFTITSLVGGVVGGAYSAYKNVNPIEDIVAPGNGDAADALGDLYGASIEELLNLLYDASQSTDNEYTFAKLIEDYNLDLRALLKMMGVDVSGVDQNSEDWKALEAIPILSVLTGDMQPILDAVKLRSLYMFIPSLMSGKTIDDILSKEAQAKLGDYTIGDLMATDENGELGFITAIKGTHHRGIRPPFSVRRGGQVDGRGICGLWRHRMVHEPLGTHSSGHAYRQAARSVLRCGDHRQP